MESREKKYRWTQYSVSPTCKLISMLCVRTTYTNYRRPRTRNVTFPSLKKYVSCLMNESSDVAYPPFGVFLRSEI